MKVHEALVWRFHVKRNKDLKSPSEIKFNTLPWYWQYYKVFVPLYIGNNTL